MPSPARFPALLSGVLAGIVCSSRAPAQTYEVVNAFTIPAAQPVAGLVQGTDGLFYGTTRGGGANAGGTVFKIDSAGNLTTLHTFSYEDGNDPEAGVIQASDGKFYGTTYGGGAHGFGTVFKIDSAGNLTTLYSFAGKDFGDGSYPVARVIQAADGNFYGTTSSGGTGFNDLGTVFQMTPAGAVTIVHTFTGSDGVYPVADLVQSAADGKLYGTTQAGGGGSGTVFKMDLAGTNFVSLHSFAVTDGAAPSAALVAANGKFYGTTKSGGSAGFGTIFSIDSAGSFATLRNLGTLDGHVPAAPLFLASDGKLYGTTSAGGTGDLGTVFKIDFAGNLTILESFAGPDGAYPVAAVTQGTDGAFYGTTQHGGTNGNDAGGTVFKMTSAGLVTTLENFGDASTGYEPESGVMQASDGNLYGTTFWGGPTNNGTVYMLTLAGARTVLHNFVETNGGQPWAKLVQLTAGGPLYGTASRGGTSHWGAVFSITTAGSYSLLHSFNGTDGLGPRDAALVQLPADSMLYGMTEQGGTGLGNAFKVSTGGSLTSIHAFNLTDGAYPSDGLLLAPDGNFYGTTASGGAANAQGNVIRITPAGSVTVLHEFNHTQGADDDGMWPVAGLIRAADGNFYGTTRAGGANSLGNVFRIGSAGAYATIHSFSGGDGNAPYGNLLQGADGKLYGTTYGGGAYGHGTVFSIDTAGTGFTTLHSLTLEEGSGPVGGLIQATDGKLYGVTDAGGPGKAGVVFRLTLPGCTPPSPPTAGNNGPVCAGSSLQLTASTIAGAAYAWTGPNGFSSALQNPSIASATAAASGTYSVTATVAGCTSSPATTVATVIASCVASKFYPLTPCRIADTRNAVGPLGGPALSAGASRTFPVTGTCSVPSTARALSLNVTVTGATVAGDLKLYADGAAVPVSTALSYRPTVARANNAFAAPSASGGLAVYCSQPSGTVQLILDVNGYFQ